MTKCEREWSVWLISYGIDGDLDRDEVEVTSDIETAHEVYDRWTAIKNAPPGRNGRRSSVVDVMLLSRIVLPWEWVTPRPKCANERCDRIVSPDRRKGAIYCSDACAQAVSSRSYRRRRQGVGGVA